MFCADALVIVAAPPLVLTHAQDEMLPPVVEDATPFNDTLLTGHVIVADGIAVQVGGVLDVPVLRSIAPVYGCKVIVPA